VIISIRGGHIQEGHPIGGLIAVPTSLRDYHEFSSRDHPCGSSLALDDRELGLASQYKEQLVAIGVLLPRWLAQEGGYTTKAIMKGELSNGTVGFPPQSYQVDLGHGPDSTLAEIMHDHVAPPLPLLASVADDSI
jgi:hypothetical protein